jgi:peroxiredoxin
MAGLRSGEHAPDFTLTTVDGTPWTLSEHLAAGTGGNSDVVLVFLRGFF